MGFFCLVGQNYPLGFHATFTVTRLFISIPGKKMYAAGLPRAASFFCRL
jgi:hypothetical protein